MRLVVVLLLPVNIPSFSKMCSAKFWPDDAGCCLWYAFKTGVTKALAETLLSWFAATFTINITCKFYFDFFANEIIESHQSIISK